MNNTLNPSPQVDDRNRLALLWKAFEEAELRIAELEAELDRRRVDPRPVAAAPLHVQAPPGPEAPTPVSPDPAGQLAAFQRERAALQERIRALEARLDASSHALARERTRAEHALQLHDLARAGREREARALLDTQARVATTMRALGDVREEKRLLQARHDALVRSLRQLEGDHAHALNALREADAKLAQDQATIEALLAAADRAKSQSPPATRASPWSPVERLYPIDVHRIDEIHGVQEREVAALRRVGLNLVDTLLYAELGPLQDATGISACRLAKLRAHAELMSIRGIGPEWASCLYAAGLRGIDDIARLTPARVAEIILEHSRATLDPMAYPLAQRTVPARARAIHAECLRHGTDA